MIITCAACERVILDRYLVKVLDRSWHSACVRCFDCRAVLTDKCYTKDGKLFCRTDFFRRNGTKCAGCSQGISPQEMVHKARDKVFHLNCFTCTICRRQLCTGEELYVLDDTKFICKEDYMHAKQDSLFSSDDDDNDDDNSLESSLSAAASARLHPHHHDHHHPPLGLSPVGSTGMVTSSGENSNPGKEDHGNDSDASDGDADGEGEPRDPGAENESLEDSSSAGSKRRGPRTTIKAKQLEILKTAFSQTPKPTRHIREQLAKETGLPMRVIQVWFQNKRSKERRLKQLTSMGRGPFFGSSRKIRGFPMNINPGMDHDGPNPPFPYFADPSFGDFPHGGPGGGPGGPPPQGFHDFFPHGGGPGGGHFSGGPGSGLPPPGSRPGLDFPPPGPGNGSFSDHQGSEDMGW